MLRLFFKEGLKEVMGRLMAEIKLRGYLIVRIFSA